MSYSVTVSPNSVFTGQRIRIAVDGLDLEAEESFDLAIFRGDVRVYGYDPEGIIVNAYTGSVSVLCARSWLGGGSSTLLTLRVYIFSRAGTQLDTEEAIFRLVKGEYVLPFSIDEEVAKLPVSGWLPRDTKRKNLYQLMLANGVNIVKGADGNPHFTFVRPAAGDPEAIDTDDLFLGGDVEYTKPYAAVTVLEHTYTALLDQNAVTLYDNTKDREPIVNKEVWFDQAPVIIETLTATEGLSVLFATENSAILSGQGVLTGVPYTHSTQTVQRENAGGERGKMVNVNDCTMVSLINSENLVNRLFAFYCPAHSIKKIRTALVFNRERCGRAYRFKNPFGEEVTAFLASTELTASSFVRGACEFYADYAPAGQEGLYQHCTVLDKASFEADGGVFVTPAGVTSMKVVIIGGGSGGGSGWPGKNGKDARVHTNVAADADISGMWYGAEGGDGGQGGEGGAPGQVFSMTIENPAASYAYTIGDGGEGGAATGFIPDTESELRAALSAEDPDTEYSAAEIEAMLAREAALTDWSGAPNPGSAGTASTFGSWSSESPGSYIPEAGVYDPINGKFYALTGNRGIAGGKGGARKVESGGNYTWVTDGEDVPTVDTTYHGGRTGAPMTQVDELPECELTIYGGNGAGAAVGLDRAAHEHMDGDESYQAWWEVTVDGV